MSDAKAKESQKIEKARNKLKKQFADEDKAITPKALQQTKELIYRWIFRHSGERIPLKNKEIVLFDANRHQEPVHSKFVRQLLSELQSPESSERVFKAKRIEATDES